MRPLGSRALVLTLALVLGADACANTHDAFVTDPAAKPALAALEPPAPGRLPALAKPLKYELALEIDPAAPRFRGDVAIKLEVARPTRELVLHAQDLRVASVVARQNGRELAGRASLGEGEREGELVLAFPEALAAGPAELAIAFDAPLGRGLRGLYRVDKKGRAFAFTQFEPADARRAFPCFDEPGFKVPFDVRVTTAAENQAFSNMPLARRALSADKKRATHVFATTPPLPTYLIAFAVGPLSVTELPAASAKPGGPPIRLVTTEPAGAEGELALEAAAALTESLARYFDRPFPYPKLDLVAVPEFAAGAMENAGLVTFREELLLVDRKTSSTRARRNMAIVVAHEIAHHWFGDLVTMTWWDDLWLNEAFASFMETKTTDEVYPALETGFELAGVKAHVMADDALESAQPIRKPVRNVGEAREAFNDFTYTKGPSVLTMVEALLGSETFRAGIRAYVAEHANGNASAADLWGALTRTSGVDVSAVARDFFDRPGLPVISAKLACSDAPPSVTLAQSRYAVLTRAEREAVAKGGQPPAWARAQTPWHVPVCVTFEGGAGPVCTLFDKTESAPIALPLPAGACPKWLHPNANEAGYYAWRLERAGAGGLTALAGAWGRLGIPERLGVVGNVFALAKTHAIEPDAVVEITRAAADHEERHHLVLQELATNLDVARDRLVVGPQASRDFEALARSVFGPAARLRGFDAKAFDTDTDKLGRRVALGALGSLTDDPWLFDEVEKRVGAFLAGQLDARPEAADMNTVALRLAMRRGDAARQDALLAALRKGDLAPEARVSVTSALAATDDPALVARGLGMIFDPAVRAQDAFRAFDAAVARPGARRAAFEWLARNLPEVDRRLPPSVADALASGLARLCTVEEPARSKLVADLGAAFGAKPGVGLTTKQTLETAARCAEDRSVDGTSFAAALKNATKSASLRARR